MRIKKTSQTAPVQAQVVNTYSISTTDTYSCDYINDSNTYSTSEVNTGKTWIDGKPIYRVCKNAGNLPNNGRIQPTFEGLIPSDATVVRLYGIAHRYDSTNNVHDYRSIETMTTLFMYRPIYYSLYIDTNQDYSNWEGIVIIEYTKSN